MASHTIAGETFRSTDAFARALRAQADGVGPWSDRNDVTGLDGLERAIDDAGPWLPIVADVVRQWIDDDDIARRSLGVAVAWRVAGAIGASFLVERLTGQRARFDGVAPVGVPTNQPDLRWSLLMALDRAVTVDDVDAIALLPDRPMPRTAIVIGCSGCLSHHTPPMPTSSQTSAPFSLA